MGVFALFTCMFSLVISARFLLIIVSRLFLHYYCESYFGLILLQIVMRLGIILQQWDVSATTRSDSCSGKTLTKPVKTKTKTKNKQSSTEVSKLSMLQKRHESEKNVVDSIRNSFINR